MFTDANLVPKNFQVRCDICIVGAGAAGIAMALELKNSSLNVCILESGGINYEEQVQKLYDFEATGLSISPRSRIHQFGGTTTAWMGLWREMDAIDFESRGWIPNSGWPFGKKELAPYYKRADELLSASYLLTFLSQPELFVGSDVLKTVEFQRIKKADLDFGKKFFKELAKAKNIAICLNANVVNLEASQNCRMVERADVKTLRGNNFQIKARLFILAAGGIENARLLLLSDSVNKRGLGNDYDQVGRYYMDHPKGVAGKVRLRKTLPVARVALSGLRLSDETQRKFEVSNSLVMLLPHRLSFLHKVKKKLLNLSAQADTFSVRNFMEQVPNPDNRVTLSDTKDALACRKVNINWQINEADKKSMLSFHQILRDELKRLAIGELESPLIDQEYSKWPIAQDASHHMGTTRMGSDPKNSVVNTDLKIHGVENLYVVGSSVFPTGGYANPMATIVALAVRLTEHLKSKEAL